MPVEIQTEPFRHTDVIGSWDEPLLRRCQAEFDILPEGAWYNFRNEREIKDAMTFSTARDNGAVACWAWREYIASAVFCAAISQRFGIPDLQFDELGGGLHRIPPGGLLASHIDFNRDAAGRYRRINLLLYLNDDWTGTVEGSLLMYDKDHQLQKAVTPDFNREIIFECSDHSWHGHPVPHETLWRKSMAAYYFTDYAPDDYGQQHDTVWMPV